MRVRSLAATPTFPSHPPPPPSFSPLAVQAERRAGVPRHRLPAGLVDLPRHARLFDMQPVRRQRGRGRFVGRPVRRRRVGAHRVPHVRHDARGVWRQVRRRLRSIEVARLRPRASDARACARASPQVGPGTKQRRVGPFVGIQMGALLRCVDTSHHPSAVSRMGVVTNLHLCSMGIEGTLESLGAPPPSIRHRFICSSRGVSPSSRPVPLPLQTRPGVQVHGVPLHRPPPRVFEQMLPPFMGVRFRCDDGFTIGISFARRPCV